MSEFEDAKSVSAAVADTADAAVVESAVDAQVADLEKSIGEISVKAAEEESVSAAAVGTVDLTSDKPLKTRVAGAKSLAAHLSAGIQFDDPSLKLPPWIISSLIEDFGFKAPSQIQAVTIPRIMSRRNVIAQAQTGSGKTIAFTIGMLANVDVSQPVVQAVCLTPTRELATQIIKDAVAPMAKRMPGLTWELLVKEQPGEASKYVGKCTAHVVVGTPGTVSGLIDRRYLSNVQNTVKIFVCDEADEMVAEKDSHGKDTKKIKSKLREDVQTLLFSATFPPEVLDYSRQLVAKPFIVTLASNELMVLKNIYQLRLCMDRVAGFEQLAVGMMVDYPVQGTRDNSCGVIVAIRPDGSLEVQTPDRQVIMIPRHAIRTINARKLTVLKSIYSKLSIDQSIIFCPTRIQAEQVASLLRNDDYTVSFMHGELDPYGRDFAIAQFKDGLTKVLVTTNVLAKGLDVPAVDLVINYSLPTKYQGRPDPLTYLHRIGRCARFGRPGSAITFLDDAQDEARMMDIERHYNFTADRRMTEEWNPNEIESLSISVRERAEDNAAESVELIQTPVVADEGDLGNAASASSGAGAVRGGLRGRK